MLVLFRTEFLASWIAVRAPDAVNLGAEQRLVQQVACRQRGGQLVLERFSPRSRWDRCMFAIRRLGVARVEFLLGRESGGAESVRLAAGQIQSGCSSGCVLGA